MSETPDYAALARQYLDLWEEHLTALANDPTLAAQMSAMFALMGQAMPLATPGAGFPGGIGANPFADVQRAMAQAMAGMTPPAQGPAAGPTTGKERPADD
jgi:hypothetical protein